MDSKSAARPGGALFTYMPKELPRRFPPLSEKPLTCLQIYTFFSLFQLFRNHVRTQSRQQIIYHKG
jgi:hypothetical protein